MLPAAIAPSRQRPRRHFGPAHEDILEERIELDALEDDEVGLVGLGKQQQPLEDLLDPSELVERDVDLRARVAVRAVQELEVAARDRHRRAQLVRRVVQEALLPLQERRALLRLVLDDRERLLPPARVPHHREEHRRHQRDLEQLAPELVAR